MEWHKDCDISAYVLISESHIAGNGEIWRESQEVELARLLVKPDLRGKGLGKILLRDLHERSKHFKLKTWLRVHPDNHHALALYQRNGFSIVDDRLQREFNRGQPVDFLWMASLI